MIRCLTKQLDNRGFNLTELMVGVAISVLLFTAVYGFYDASRQSYFAGVSGQTLQDGANIMLSKIMEGEPESGVVYRLSTAQSYMIPNGVGTALYTCGGAAKVAPCNTTWPFSEVYFCQDSPCTYNDASARWYYLNSTATSLIYHHPKTGGGTQEETIYAAPSNSTLSLRFVAATNTPANEVEIDAAVIENVPAKVTNQRLQTTGAVSTYVLLRNHL
jgi:prepilin-type N-terminal cleavage/methylation domain-containing protein